MGSDPGHLILLGIAFLGSMACFSFVLKLFSAPPPEEVGSLASLSPKAAAELSAFDVLNPQGGFFERLDFLLARKLGLDRRLEELYMLKGRPENTTPLEMLHAQELVGFAIPALIFFLVGYGLEGGYNPIWFLLSPVCFFLPEFIYRSQIAERQYQIVRNFPALVDLAALTIESGLDYMAALDRIIKAAQNKTELELEVEKTLKEVQLGYARREALRRMALRIGVQDVRSFVGLIIQSDELGTSLVDLLRNFAADMRFRRLSKAEKAAAEASTKMLFPILFFIFPTTFILMLSPMLLSVFQGGLGF